EESQIQIDETGGKIRLSDRLRMIASQLDLTKPLILLIPDILTPGKCEEWIHRIQAQGPEAAPINTARGVMLDTQIRNNRRVIIDDETLAGELFERVKERVPREIHGMS